jgi:hypothetical protein
VAPVAAARSVGTGALSESQAVDEPDPSNSNEPALAMPLGSLAQAARWKILRRVKRILIVVGAFTLAANVLLLLNLPNEINLIIQGRQLGPAGALQVRQIATTYGFVAYGSIATVAVLFVVLGLCIKQFPVAVTTTSLVLFTFAMAALMVFNPKSLVHDLVTQVIVIIILIRATMTARAYQADKRKHAIPEGLF